MNVLKMSCTGDAFQFATESGELQELVPDLPNELFLRRVWPLLFEGRDRLGQVDTLLKLRLISKLWIQFVDDCEEMFNHHLHLVQCMSEKQYKNAPGRFRNWSKNMMHAHDT